MRRTSAATPDAFVQRFPRRVRVPYDQPDRSLDHLFGDTDRWRAARQADRTAALREPLAGLELTDYETRILGHIADASDTSSPCSTRCCTAPAPPPR